MEISIVVLTQNEQVNLPSCLDSVRTFDDVLVFDSFSTDETVGIASECGARVVQRVFDNYASQRNASLEQPFKHEWILMLDADERMPESLAREIAQLPAEPVDVSGQPITIYRMRRMDFFFGRWLRRSSGYPTWFGRLMRRGKVRVERAVNEEYCTDGQVGLLNEHIVHYPFTRGIRHWFERHNDYSSKEARTLAGEQQAASKLGWSSHFASDPAKRRRAFKQFAYSMPMRPLLTFCYLYFFRLGLLDGQSGFTFCVLRSIYEYMIELKKREALWVENGKSV